MLGVTIFVWAPGEEQHADFYCADHIVGASDASYNITIQRETGPLRMIGFDAFIVDDTNQLISSDVAITFNSGASWTRPRTGLHDTYNGFINFEDGFNRLDVFDLSPGPNRFVRMTNITVGDTTCTGYFTPQPTTTTTTITTSTSTTTTATLTTIVTGKQVYADIDRQTRDRKTHV